MKLKKTLSIMTAAAMSATMALAAIGCSGNATPENTYEYNIPQDYCRTYYEVFVRSFADGDGDGIGDLAGLADNLDYLNDGNDKTTTDLGVNGIWMMPIHKSPSYHKYDVIDYYSIDKEYGTLDDFDYLVEQCNKRDIWIQMDLVLNHTSNEHPWFKAAIKDAKAGYMPEDSEAMQRYVFVYAEEDPDTGKRKKPVGNYRSVPGADGYYYLANFNTDTMPDVNLKNESVREEIKKIVDFWLERGVHSFRLDAVPWACADAVIYTADNEEFWTWFNDYCNEKGASVYGKEGDGISRYCYNVGEVYGAQSVVEEYFKTGMTNFNYGMGGSLNAGFAKAARGNYADGATYVEQLAAAQANVLALDENALLSNFLSNHDNDRSAGYFMYEPDKIKIAASLYLLAPGNPYIYYGEEIGAAGSGNDPNRRLPFNWGDKKHKALENPPDSNYRGEQSFGSVADQTNDANSILTYYRRAIQLRNRFPEIGRGLVKAYAINGDGELKVAADVKGSADKYATVNELNTGVAAYTLTHGDDSVLIINNFGDTAVKFKASDFSDWTVQGTLKANKKGDASFKSGAVSLAAGTVIILKK